MQYIKYLAWCLEKVNNQYMITFISMIIYIFNYFKIFQVLLTLLMALI